MTQGYLSNDTSDEIKMISENSKMIQIDWKEVVDKIKTFIETSIEDYEKQYKFQVNRGKEMQEYKSKQELIEEISKRAKLFIDEFYDIPETDKNELVDGVDRTPAQMISYQLGWIDLIIYWEQQEQKGITVVTPHPDYKWNNLGGLYESFYKQYKEYSLQELGDLFKESERAIIQLIENLTNDELFQSGVGKWTSSTSANWTVWRYVHINTVAPFKSFRAKIRKQKKLKQY